MEDNVSKIKDRLDVIEVLSGYMKLQKAGINYKGRCPFHNEKTPSFFVSPERQIWHCFGCSKGGDMFEFVKEIEGVEFPEALRILASKAGIELEQFRPKPGESVDAKQKLFEITELATKFFQKQFESPTGAEALAYLRDRGLTDETIKEFRLGFAPNDWESLAQFLKSRGYGESEIVDAGLGVRRSAEQGREGIYDRFRSRITFPIFDLTGQVVGFTARVFEPSSAKSGQPGLAKTGESMAKYINTPQTLIYDKSRVLYGLSQAKLDIKKSDRCILVEGNMDALMSYQAGVRNVVASSGTALTPTHLRLLQRYTKNLGFCFDTDQAGAMATRRGIGLALAQQFNIAILEIKDPECKDPADYVKKHGSKWSEVVVSAKPVIDYYFDRARSSYNPTSAESKSQIISAVAPFVKRLSAQVERAHWVAQLASLLRVPDSAIIADIASAKDDLDAYARDSGEVEAPRQTAEAKVQETSDAVQEMILSVVLKSPMLLREEIKALSADVLDERTTTILRQLVEEPQPFEFKTFVARFEGESALQLEFAHLRAQELWEGFSDEHLKQEFHSLINMVRRRTISSRLASLQFDVKEAEASKDQHRLARLASEFNELARQLILTHNPYGNVEKNKKTSEVGKETRAEVKDQTETEVG
jgi:DNA primase